MGVRAELVEKFCDVFNFGCIFLKHLLNLSEIFKTDAPLILVVQINQHDIIRKVLLNRQQKSPKLMDEKVLVIVHFPLFG